MKFLIIIKYVWGNVHEKVTQRNSEGVRGERERGENYAFPIPKLVKSKTSIGVW